MLSASYNYITVMECKFITDMPRKGHLDPPLYIVYSRSKGIANFVEKVNQRDKPLITHSSVQIFISKQA